MYFRLTKANLGEAVNKIAAQGFLWDRRFHFIVQGRIRSFKMFQNPVQVVLQAIQWSRCCLIYPFMNHSILWGLDEVASLSLFLFDGDEEAAEVACTEALMVTSLDDLKEESWTILDGFREYLEKVALVVVVDKDLVLLKNIDVLADLDSHVGKVLA